MPDAKALRPAVFLDRDGTICEEMGYLNHISRLHIFPFAAAAIARLNKAGLPVIVVTNQSGISRQIFPESLVTQIHSRISQELSAAGARVDGYYYCAHTKQDDCNCRKPLPGLLEQAAREHGLRLDRSFVVGDRYGDVELAHGVLGALEVAAHPVEAVGNAAEHGGILPRTWFGDGSVHRWLKELPSGLKSAIFGALLRHD